MSETASGRGDLSKRSSPKRRITHGRPDNVSGLPTALSGVAASEMAKTIRQLYEDHDGKVTDKWSLYLAEYDRLFAPYRERSIRLLEIGVQNGGSLERWGKYFRNAEKIVGCDINMDCARLQFDDPRIALVLADASADEAQRQILSHSPRFDLIIDDGSHQSRDVVSAFSKYFSSLVDDGLYIVEDLHCSYWQEFSGGLYHSSSSIAFLKQLVDIINHEHWGIDKSRSEFLHSFESCYGIRLYEGLLDKIHSIEFLNSICVIKKQDPHKNGLGPRVIAGTVEIIVPGFLPYNGMTHPKSDQRGNHWAADNREFAARQRDELEATLRDIRQSLTFITTESVQQMASLTTQLAACGTELAERREEAFQRRELEATLDQTRQQLTLMEAELIACRSELVAKEQDADRYRGELEATLHQTRQHLTSATTELATCRAELVAKEQDADRYRGELEAALHQTRQHLTLVTTELASRRAELAAKQEEIARQREQQETALGETRRELTLMAAEFADRVAALEAERTSALAESENRAQVQIRAVRSQLVDTEAALAKAKRSARNAASWPKRASNRRVERQLLRSNLFDTAWYLREYPAATDGGRSAVSHYLEAGYLQGYRPNPLFDTRWYLDRYDDVRRAGINPLVHYMRNGAIEGRDPGPEFETDFYLLTYPDVRMSGMNPLAHYLKYGKTEGRLCMRPRDGH
jgi:hypothetical protein